MQRDAIERIGLSALLLEPEMLEAVEADVHLVGTLLSLNKAMPETTRETARAVVRKVVEELEKRLSTRTRATVTGALDRSARISRPRHRDIDWDRTIRANLKNYLPEYGTVVPERLIGYGHAGQSVKKDVILCVDQSGSMAASVVYASVFGAVLASMRSISTRLVVFDTAVVDLTEQLDDPVDVLFGTQLGGGTDINRALAYCQSQITRPTDTVVVLISDLYEGGIRDEMLKRVAAMKASGTQFVTLLALSDEGAPAYDHAHAEALAALGAPAFACTPDLFPDVMAAAIERRPCPYRTWRCASKRCASTRGPARLAAPDARAKSVPPPVATAHVQVKPLAQSLALYMAQYMALYMAHRVARSPAKSLGTVGARRRASRRRTRCFRCLGRCGIGHPGRRGGHAGHRRSAALLTALRARWRSSPGVSPVQGSRLARAGVL